MSIEKLKRVLQRVRQKNPYDGDCVHWKALKRAVMVECGTSGATYRANRRALQDLGWIKIRGQKIVLTGKDITEDF